MNTDTDLLSPRRILIVEDDPLTAHSLRLALSVERHSVDIANDGRQALTMFEIKGGYDVVITDFKIPTMDGLELAEAIKQRSPSTPVLLITAFAETVGGMMGSVSNVDMLLPKPVSLAKLQEALRAVCASSPANA